MIITIEQVFDVRCDYCSFTEEIRVKTWRDLLDEMKQGGWAGFKDLKTGKWKNKCPGCRGK